jgi:phosphoglycolate phosphatase
MRPLGPGFSHKPRLLLFDLDGTLIDSVADLAGALGRAFADFGLPPHDTAAVRSMLGDGQRILVQRALEAAGGDLGQLDEMLARYRHHYSEHLYDTTACFVGVAETLRRLPPAIPKAVATNKPGLWARKLVAHLQLDVHLRWVLGEDDVGARKPDPRMLLCLCERAGVEPSEALMVGDSRIDLLAAQAAGMPAALCTYGYCDPETLTQVRSAQRREAGALGSLARPYVLEGFADLLGLIEPAAAALG